MLDGRYAVFGYVTEGANLLKEMQARECRKGPVNSAVLPVWVLEAVACCVAQGASVVKEIQASWHVTGHDCRVLLHCVSKAALGWWPPRLRSWQSTLIGPPSSLAANRKCVPMLRRWATRL